MVVGGAKMVPFLLDCTSGGGGTGTLEKSGGVGLRTADAPEGNLSEMVLEKCLTSAGTKVGADPGIPSV